MGTAGARRMRERFSWRRTAEETLSLYEEVLAIQEETRSASRGQPARLERPK